MRLKPVENTPEPEYPDYEGFHQNRRDFLLRMAALAGAVLAGPAIAGCGKKEEPQRLGGVIAVPQPPPPKNPAQPVPDPHRPVPPPERLAGEVVVPDPIEAPPEQNIRGGMRAPCKPDELEKEEKPPPPDDNEKPQPPKDAPK